ncbi:MAG: HAMP domain-containing histidine kinase [Lachnospiraceae bacterium]|nr:HAMP domain-containing histidine kinase [Lachnospiraceae bacterium]
MRNENRRNSFLRIFVFVSALFFIAVILAIGMFYYIFGITEPEGLSLATWPNRFTDNFSVWMENDNDSIKIEEIGLKRLQEYGLWLQVLDETGQEIFCYDKPEHYPVKYTASQLLSLSTSAYQQGNTIFVSNYENAGKTWSYLIGFPYAIGKHMLYYNGENVGRLSPLFCRGIFLLLCAVFLLVVWYGFWLTGHLGKIAKGIRNISLHSYFPLREKGVFGEIYEALNQMDAKVRHSDKVQQETERMRREWIANITHDLKTPLSPIKGYAELLMNGPVLECKAIQEYGGIILRNVNHTEKMINDLKLTYQLDSGSVPYHPQRMRLVRFLKELVIDIMNDPAFAGRHLEFESNVRELEVCFDPDLFRRAVNNIVINALSHNPPETKVEICVHADFSKEASSYASKDFSKEISICISDNGIGMSDKEQEELFQRYYRGTSTKEKPEGSGLGMAIAKQIIMIHGGDITVKSRIGEGTQFTIFFPQKMGF